MNRLKRLATSIRSAESFRTWGVIAIVICVMQLSDSLGDASITQIMVFWTVRIAALIACLFTAQLLVIHCLSNRFKSPHWLKPVVLFPLLAAAPMTAIEVILEQLLPMNPDQDDSQLWASSVLLAIASEYLTILSYLMSINLVLWLLLDIRKNQTEENSEQFQSKPLPVPEFFRKSRQIGAEELVAINAEEHYIRLHSATESELIHHVFRDAINELADWPGLRVHRSWWVAENAIVQPIKKGRRYTLSLRGGLIVPVSDSYLQHARDRGVIKPGRRAAAVNNSQD